MSLSSNVMEDQVHLEFERVWSVVEMFITWTLTFDKEYDILSLSYYLIADILSESVLNKHSTYSYS